MKNKQTISLEDTHTAGLPEESIPDEDVRYIELVKDNYRQLGNQCKELLNRFYFRKESLKDIASYFTWTETKKKNNKYRCIQKLREKVNDNMNDNIH